MSILEDFLTNNLTNLPNETQLTDNKTPYSSQMHHNRHHNSTQLVHSVMHGEHINHLHHTNNTFAKTNNTLTQNRFTSARNRLPCHQKNANDFLAGNTPGVMAFYAPEEQCHAAKHPCPQPANIRANTRADNATIEDAETVSRLVAWREEASY